MAQLASLLASLPQSNEMRMSASGTALWIYWPSDLEPAVNQTLQNYGGMFIASNNSQSLWFFFNTDVFLALARLAVWGRFNSLQVSIQSIPARLILGGRREISIEVESILAQQEVMFADSLDIWIHPKSIGKDFNIPGITFEPVPPQQGMANLRWSTLNADTRLPYTSSQGWYAILRPLGNPLDKKYQQAWPKMQEVISTALETHKLKFLVQDNFITVSVDNLLILRTWLKELLSNFQRIKINDRDAYWPCVTVLIDRRGLNFSHDLHKKVGLPWPKLMPDFPYMSYRNAYLIGDGFAIQDIHFSDAQNSMDDWCNVILDEGNTQNRALPVLMSSQLSVGSSNGCFFCGVPTHTAQECPTRSLPIEVEDVWAQVSTLNLETINDGFKVIEKTLTEHKHTGYARLLGKKDTPANILRAIFEINSALQVRSMEHFWRTKAREYSKMDEEPPIPRDDHPIWEILDNFIQAEPEEFYITIKNIYRLLETYPRESRLRTLLGFVYVCQNLPDRALASFKEAAASTLSPLLQAWNEYLQGRVAEMSGRYSEAIAQYDQVARVSPQWKELEYRKLVCQVKMGFAEQIIPQLITIIQNSPDYFNRCLIDPELGRGHLLILTQLYPLWTNVLTAATNEKDAVNNIADRVREWFLPEHPSYQTLNRQVEEVRSLLKVKNYVAFLQVVNQRPLLEKLIDEHIERQIEELKERYKNYLDTLQSIHDEAAWFPFLKLLRDFSKDFNDCASIINWAFTSNFQEAAVFQQAQASTSDIDAFINKLKKRLHLLRTVRDGTLYGVTFLKAFFWFEVAGLIICFLGIPGVVLYGETMGLGWLKSILASQQWEIQKVLFGIITVVSIGLAALISTVVFDKKRNTLLANAKAQREQLQNERLERIRKKRKAQKANKVDERDV